MIDNFALVVTHIAILLLFWKIIKTQDPDEAPPVPKKPVRRFQDSNRTDA